MSDAKNPAASMGEFGKALVQQTADELARRLKISAAESPEICCLMLVIHYAMEITMERLGPQGVAFMLESASMFAKQAVTGEVAE
jgi:hypothetical protein